MNLLINTEAPEPVYEQIVRQVHQGIRAGTLKPGTPLPTVRQLSADLQLNRNTVARAYKVLETQGVILTAGRKGTFVREQAGSEVARLKTGNANQAMRRAVDALKAAGLTRKEILTAFEDALAAKGTKP